MTSMEDNVKPTACASTFTTRRDINVTSGCHAGGAGWRNVEKFRLVNLKKISCGDGARLGSHQVAAIQMIEHLKSAFVIAVVDVVVITGWLVANFAVVVSGLQWITETIKHGKFLELL